MIRWIVGSSLRFRGLVVAIAAGLLAYGVVQLRDAPVDVLPEFTPPTVEIQTEALGLSAAEVEQLITVPIEQDLLAGVAFVDEIRSQSVPGLSSIVAVFEPGTDILAARQVVAERLTQAHALPHVSKAPEMLQPLSSTSRVMMVGLSSETLTPIEMSVLARWTIEPRLTGVTGVANVADLRPAGAAAAGAGRPGTAAGEGVSLIQVIETTGNALWVSPLSFVEASTPGTGGFIDTANQRLSIQHISPITTPEDLAQVSVEGSDADDRRGGQRRRGSPAAHRRRDARRRRADARHREVPRGQHPRRDARRRGARSQRWHPACPASPSTRPSTGRRRTSTSRSTT